MILQLKNPRYCEYARVMVYTGLVHGVWTQGLNPAALTPRSQPNLQTPRLSPKPNYAYRFSVANRGTYSTGIVIFPYSLQTTRKTMVEPPTYRARFPHPSFPHNCHEAAPAGAPKPKEIPTGTKCILLTVNKKAEEYGGSSTSGVGWLRISGYVRIM